jgi:hypothetical protein
MIYGTEERLHETGARFATFPKKISGSTCIAYLCLPNQYAMQQNCCTCIRIRHVVHKIYNKDCEARMIF